MYGWSLRYAGLSLEDVSAVGSSNWKFCGSVQFSEQNYSGEVTRPLARAIVDISANDLTKLKSQGLKLVKKKNAQKR